MGSWARGHLRRHSSLAGARASKDRLRPPLSDDEPHDGVGQDEVDEGQDQQPAAHRACSVPPAPPCEPAGGAQGDGACSHSGGHFSGKAVVDAWRIRFLELAVLHVYLR